MQSLNGSNVTPILAMCWLDMNNNGGEMDRETLSTSVEGLLQWFTSKHTKYEHSVEIWNLYAALKMLFFLPPHKFSWLNLMLLPD